MLKSIVKIPCEVQALHIREIKFDVTWPYVKRQTAKMASEFVFFSSNPSLNHIKIEKCLLLITTNTNIFTLLFNELNTDGKSFIFAVCRLTYDHVTSNLISLLSWSNCYVCAGQYDSRWVRTSLYGLTIMDKSLGINLHFWRFYAHARREYNFTCLTSRPPHPHTMFKTTTWRKYKQRINSAFTLVRTRKLIIRHFWSGLKYGRENHRFWS